MKVTFRSTVGNFSYNLSSVKW